MIVRAGAAFVLALTPAVPVLAAPAQVTPEGAVLFARCAACHLPGGEGVPGTFPPLGAQIPRYAASRAGREYMVTAVSHGLAGSLLVDGDAFNGFMPAQGLGDDEAVAVLNYVVRAIAKAGPGAKAFTRAEVAAIRRRHATAMAQDSRALRPDALAGGAR